jgi:hypothetical protein
MAMFSTGATTAAVFIAAVLPGDAEASAAPTEQPSAAALYERCVVVSAEWHSTPYGPRPPTKAHRLRKLAACDAFYRELAGSEPEASGRCRAPDTAPPAEGDAAGRAAAIYRSCRAAALAGPQRQSDQGDGAAPQEHRFHL